ncbi:CdaR family protein [Halodesulfovibrio marinisediminis]|uniref:YbbR-like protein n=1 Tax=Halodesulfovibrio marinisediminis DSM 17456 TaxID=1121457 RepID=A0A1N6DF90_9BACT|nr:CdaR family protein [Halodesulfovibrio marinisediminis]SIN69304.1 YbbR-like protein [Halodesulfovibrio marinisediminis DSM 17456]
MGVSWRHLLLAFIMASCLWVVISGREQVEIWEKASVELKGMPENLTLLSGLPPEVEIRVRGPKGLIRTITDRKLTYVLDLSKVSPGLNVLPIQANGIRLGKAFDVVELRPSRLTLEVDKLVQRKLPIVPRWSGELPTDLFVESASVKPQFVIVRGPDSELAALSEVEAVTPAPNKKNPGTVTLDGTVALSLRAKATPAVVEVTYILGLRSEEKTITRNVVVIPKAGFDIKLSQSAVKLTIEVPESLKANSTLIEAVRVILELPEGIAPGEYQLPYRLELPDRIQVVGSDPETLTVTVSAK